MATNKANKQSILREGIAKKTGYTGYFNRDQTIYCSDFYTWDVDLLIQQKLVKYD